MTLFAAGTNPRMNKKGFVFTAVAVLIIIALIFLFATHERLLPRTIAQTGRVHLMDSYITNLEKDIPRAAYIAGYRSLIAMEEHISATGEYLPDVDAAFLSAFTNGTVNGTAYGIMDNSTFTNFSTAFGMLAARQGMRSNLTVLAIDAYHESPWTITLNISLTIVLEDTAGTARFNRTSSILAAVPIESIKDPLYSVGTQGRVPQTVIESNVSRPYIIEATNDTTRLQELLNSSMYIDSTDAPSFLQRFAGDLSASPFGIQSLVRTSELDAQGIAINTCKSVVDYLYFGSSPTTPNYRVVNMDATTFWLDTANLAAYDAVGKTVGQKACT